MFNIANKTFCIKIFICSIRHKNLRINFINCSLHQRQFFSVSNQSYTQRQAELLRILFNYVITEGVICININRRSLYSYFLNQTLSHFIRSGIRKRQAKDCRGINSVFNHLFNTIDYCKSFTCSRPCKKHYLPVLNIYRLLLSFVWFNFWFCCFCLHIFSL